MMPPPRRPDYAAASAAMTASPAKAVALDGIMANTSTIHGASFDEAFRKAAVNQGLAADARWTEVEWALLRLAQVPMGQIGMLEEIADPLRSSSARGRATLRGRTCDWMAECGRGLGAAILSVG
jgi:hypothetical protein